MAELELGGYSTTEKVPCITMANSIKALNISGEVLESDGNGHHKLELSGRRKQVEILQEIANKAVNACINCKEDSQCSAYVMFNEAKTLVVGPLTSGIGQNGKVNIGFGN